MESNNDYFKTDINNNPMRNSQPYNAQQPVQQPVQQRFQQPVQRPVMPPPVQQYTPNTPPPYKRKNGKLSAVIAIVLAVALIGGAAGFGGAYLGNNFISDDDNPSNPSSTTAPQQSEPSSSSSDSTKTPQTTGASLEDTLDNLIDANTDDNLTTAQLYEKVSDTIVVVNNYQKNSTRSGDDSVVLYGTGSGVVITTDGYILTNYHVIENVSKVSITIDDYDDSTQSEELAATVVGGDSSTDLAVLKVDRSQTFKAAALGDSDSLKVGQDICAIGNPSNLAKTMTKGIVSGLNRYYTSSNGYGLSSIQIDAAINPGNSGGGLFDMHGNVVGIVNAKIVSTYSENLGFAITINEAKPVINDLINYGYVTGRPVLGITTIPLNEYSAYLYGYSTVGLLVRSINEGAPVEKSDLQIGDIITGINGTTVTTLEEVQAVLKNFKSGDTVDLTVVRANELGRNETKTITVELTESGSN